MDQHPLSPVAPRSLLGVRVIGVGGYVPERVVTNAELAQQGYDADWITQRTGVRERRVAPPEMATSDMGAIAAERCLNAAGVSRNDVDLIILSTFTPDLLLPTSSSLVQRQLGIKAPAFDIHNGCAGFMFALATGMQFVATGCNRCVLVIGADTNTRVANPKDMKTFPLFGDGAGAVLLSAGAPDQGLASYILGTDGSGAELLIRKAGGSKYGISVEALERGEQYLKMEGPVVFKWAVQILKETSIEVLRHAGISAAELDLVIWHQSNIRIIDAAAEALEIERSKLYVNLDRYGNTSAASIPLALDEAHREGLIKRGSQILLSGYGAGLAWATGLLRW